MSRAQYIVVIHAGEWKIHYEGKHFGPYSSQREAIKVAVESAHKSGKNGHEAQVLIQGKDNRFRTEWTYGNDPYPPRG